MSIKKHLLIIFLLIFTLPCSAQFMESSHDSSDCELCHTGQQILQELCEGEFDLAYERAKSYIEQEADYVHFLAFASNLASCLRQNSGLIIDHSDSIDDLLWTLFLSLVEKSEMIKSMAQGRTPDVFGNSLSQFLVYDRLPDDFLHSIMNIDFIDELFKKEWKYINMTAGFHPSDGFYRGILSFVEFLVYGDTRYVDSKFHELEINTEMLISAFDDYINLTDFEDLCINQGNNSRRTYSAIAIYCAVVDALKNDDTQLVKDNVKGILRLLGLYLPDSLLHSTYSNINNLFSSEQETYRDIVFDLCTEYNGTMIGEVYKLSMELAYYYFDFMAQRRDFVDYRENLINKGYDFANFPPYVNSPHRLTPKQHVAHEEYSLKTAELLNNILVVMISEGDIFPAYYNYITSNVEQFIGLKNGEFMNYCLFLAHQLYLNDHMELALSLAENGWIIANVYGKTPYEAIRTLAMFNDLGETDIAKRALEYHFIPWLDEQLNAEEPLNGYIIEVLKCIIEVSARVYGKSAATEIMQYMDKIVYRIEKLKDVDYYIYSKFDDFKANKFAELAYSYIFLGQYDKAENFITRATELSLNAKSEDEEIINIIATVKLLLELEIGDYEDAICNYLLVKSYVDHWHSPSDFYSKLLLAASKTGNYVLMNEFVNIILARKKEEISRILFNLKQSSRENYWMELTKSENFLIETWRSLPKAEQGTLSSLVYDWSLMRKGILLFSNNLFARRLTNHPDSKVQKFYELYKQCSLLNDNQNIISNMFAINMNPAQIQAITYTLESLLINTIRRDYGEEAMQTGLLTSWQDVRAALDKKSVAVEFIRFAETAEHEAEYVALMIRKGWKEPKIIPLCTESQLSNFVSFDNDRNRRLYNTIESNKLYNLTWGILDEYLNEGDTIYYSTDGLMHQLNLECIRVRIDEKLYAEQVYDLRRLSSTREIVRPVEDVVYQKAALFGNLNYHMDNSDYVRIPSNDDTYIPSRIVSLGAVGNSGLPRTHVPKSESMIQEISHILSRANISTTSYLWNEGTEEAFKALSGKDNNLLYLYTHGFYIQGETNYQTGAEELPAMMRSGLVLSGNENLELIGGEDGLILAREIADMDLSSVDLTFLSACQTAQGEISADGVEGIQRGLKQAGVKSIIMTLWEVNADMSEKLSKNFFEELAKPNVTKREAFRIARNRARIEYPHLDWAAYIMLD